jgi:flagellin-specific chaperone FliS
MAARWWPTWRACTSAWRLYRSGSELDPAMVDEVIGLLQTLRSGWQGVQDQQKAPQRPGAAHV